MRYVELRLTPPATDFFAVGQAFADDPAVRPRALDHIRMLDDGTGVLLIQFEGDHRQAEALLDAHPDVLAYDVSEMDDGLYAYVHQEWSETAAALGAIVQTHGLIVDTPLVYTNDGDLQVTLFGDQQTIQAALAAVAETVDFSVEAVGEYHPPTTRLFARLTERQQETVRVAFELGYFRDPRTATYRDIGDKLGCRPETVGEHLRKAQATIFAELIP